MVNQLKESINRLRRESPILNAATDEAGTTVQIVEKFLNDECSLGLPCSLLVDSGDGEVNTDKPAVLIGYDRVEGGKFRIVVITESRCEHCTDEERVYGWKNRIVRPWAECSRDLKLATFPKLPDLLHEISRLAGATLVETVQTTGAVKQILQALDDLGETPLAGHVEFTEPLPAHLRNLHMKPAERLTP